MKLSKSLAIIGSHGMVGSDLARYLKPYFSKVIEIDRENYKSHRGTSFDVIINANGNSKKFWASENILDDFTASTVSVYDSIFDFPAKAYIYISSADVYENHSSEKFTSESNIIDVESLTPYGFHKYLSECIIRNNVKKYLIIRCPMILGTNLRKGPIYDILSGSQIFVSSKSSFQMITTKELSEIIFFLLSKNKTREIFNIGGRGTVLLNKVAKKLKQSIDFARDLETVNYEIDVSKLHKIYPLKTSGQYLDDFVKNYKNSYNS